MMKSVSDLKPPSDSVGQKTLSCLGFKGIVYFGRCIPSLTGILCFIPHCAGKQQGALV